MSASPPLKLSVIHRFDVVMVIPRGDLDSFTASMLEDALQHSARNGAGDLVIDLSDVSFVDLRGVDAIVRVAAEVAGRGGRVVVRYPSPLVSLMFELTGDRPGLDVDGAASTEPEWDGDRDLRPLELVR